MPYKKIFFLPNARQYYILIFYYYFIKKKLVFFIVIKIIRFTFDLSNRINNQI